MSGIFLGPLFASAGSIAGAVALADETLHGARNAVWRLGANGFTYRNGVQAYPWITPQSGMDQFDVRADLQAGGSALDVNDHGTGVWILAIEAPQWGYANDAAKAGKLDLQIRRRSDLSIVSTATIELTTDGVAPGTGGGGGGGGGGGLPPYPPADLPRDEAGSYT